MKIEIQTIDKYKRQVAKVKNKSNDLGILLVKNGLAIVQYISLNRNNLFYTKDKNYFFDLIENQKYAIENKKGFWKIVNLNIKNIYPNPNVKLI